MSNESRTERPPVVVVLGHVDHGKSSLLDYIRKSNIVAGEAGGITQHTAAYEVIHADKRITFIDTPGHAAFQAQRERGATLADIAILVVSAEDGVKAQTKEALAAIKSSNIPYIVAVNKIDLPNANVDLTLASLSEHEVYVEGRGGSVPYAPISAKTGQGIPELLDLIVLMAEVQELTGYATQPAHGIVVESHRDPKRGVSATLIIKDGTLTKGSFLAVPGAWTPVRAIIDSHDNQLDTATFSSPVTILGWSDLPAAGASVTMFNSKKDAEAHAQHGTTETSGMTTVELAEEADTAIVPIIVKADVAGSIDAITHEIAKLDNDDVIFKIIHTDVGAVSENDIKRAGGDTRTVIVGFNVKTENGVRETAERAGVTIISDTIIYKLTEQLETLRVERKPKRMVDEELGTAKILKIFSTMGHKQVVGGRVETGSIGVRNTIKILRRGEAIGTGSIIELQQAKQKASKVDEGTEFGTKIDSTVEIASGDQIVAFTKVEK